MYPRKTFVHTNSKGAKAPATSAKMSPKCHHNKRSSSPGALARSSFSSIRERDSDLAQTFTSTKTSSYSSRNLHHLLDEAVISDELFTPTSPLSEPSTFGDIPANDNTMLLQAQHGQSPNDIVRSVARSLEWLRAESHDGSLDDTIKRQDSLPHDGRTQVDGSFANVDDADIDIKDVEITERPKTYQLFEKLPLEIFHLIVNHLILDTPPNGVDRRNVDLMSLLVTSKPVHEKTLEALYRRVIVPHSRNFQKFLTQLEAHPFRGTWIRRLDFSHFSPVSLFDTASARAAARNLTAETLLRCLNLAPYMREFLAQDYLDGDIDENVIRKLLFGLPRLTALDLCGCSSVQFRNAFTSVAASPDNWPENIAIERLSLHKCLTLPSTLFGVLLPKLNRLTHLDLAGTPVTNDALKGIPKTARITHLNLAKCSLLTADGIIDFLANHPAVNQGSLEFLSLGYESSTFQLFEVSDVSRLLPILPVTLKSLSLKGSKMDAAHLPWLIEHAKHLEELALGRGLTLEDVSSIVVPPKVDSQAGKNWVPHELRFLDLTDMEPETFALSSLFIDGLLLDQRSWPLEVIELSDVIFKRVVKSQNALNRSGWRQSEIGARSWLVRGSQPVTGKGLAYTSGSFNMENGQRPWKMGAQSWGMRKIPVAHAKVGGMYGSYMFGRKL